MNEGLNKFMQIMRFDLNWIEAKLQTEESGNKIASLQGECSGYNALCFCLADSGQPNYAENKESMQTLFKYDTERDKWVCTTSNYATLSFVEARTSETIDLKAFKEKEPKLYDELLGDYKKVTNTKAYVCIKVK